MSARQPGLSCVLGLVHSRSVVVSEGVGGWPSRLQLKGQAAPTGSTAGRAQTVEPGKPHGPCILPHAATCPHSGWPPLLGAGVLHCGEVATAHRRALQDKLEKVRQRPGLTKQQAREGGGLEADTGLLSGGHSPGDCRTPLRAFDCRPAMAPLAGWLLRAGAAGRRGVPALGRRGPHCGDRARQPLRAGLLRDGAAAACQAAGAGAGGPHHHRGGVIMQREACRTSCGLHCCPSIASCGTACRGC